MPSPSPSLLARGPWSQDAVETRWSSSPWEAPAEVERKADAEIEALRKRGSPAHDGLAARLAGSHGSADRLVLDLEPARWALRLVEGADTRAMTALCVVRTEDGRWLAGRRAEWLATWAGRWSLGAGGAVEVDENPALTLTRELEEEWQLVPISTSVEALVALPTGLVSLVGLAVVPNDAAPVRDAEHDEHAWWPADVERWPDEADERLRRLAGGLAAAAAARAS
jgi:8-oxo-dGTP pyrophosphatase MutT (NUDIX family)